MVQVTNNSKGVRMVAVKAGKDGQDLRPLAPGETADLEVIETDVYNGQVESGELSVASSKKAAEGESEKKDELIAALKTKGIEGDRTKSVKELQKTLDDAEKMPKLPGA